jgi:hypothetical protein
MDNDVKIQNSLKELSESIIPPHYLELYQGLYQITKGNPKMGLENTAKILNFDYEFLLQFIVAIVKQDNSLIRYALNKSIDQIFDAVRTQGVVIENESAVDLKNYLLAIYTLSRGSDFNIIKLTQEASPKIDPFATELFYKASKGDIRRFDSILDSLGLISQKKTIIEFCLLLFKKECPWIELGGRLGVSQENAEILNAIIHFVIITTEYFTKIRPSFENKRLNTGDFTIYDRTMMTESIQKVTRIWKQYLQILYSVGILQIEKSILKGKFK